jgi:hypothetical protein
MINNNHHDVILYLIIIGQLLPRIYILYKSLLLLIKLQKNNKEK